MKRYCLTLDLKNDPALILQYEAYHKAVWPEIIDSIKTAGIEDMTIFRFEARLCMIMTVNDHFSFEQKDEADKVNPRVREWEELMWKFQQPLVQGQKWVLMNEIFDLKQCEHGSE